MDIPKQPSHLNFRSHRWPLVAEALYLLAASGISVRFELQRLLAQRRGIGARAGSIRRLFEQDLLEAGLIQSQVLPTFRRHRLTVVRLTPRGRDLCAGFGWPLAESEWERMLARHSADSQPRHTGAVLTFVHHARLRGWKTQALPPLDSPVFFPDVLVEKDGRQMYVEVELGSRKLPKWRNMQAAQGFVALCAKTPDSRRSLIQECRRVNAAGLATDLASLFQSAREKDFGPLWIEEFGYTDKNRR